MVKSTIGVTGRAFFIVLCAFVVFRWAIDRPAGSVVSIPHFITVAKSQFAHSPDEILVFDGSIKEQERLKILNLAIFHKPGSVIDFFNADPSQIARVQYLTGKTVCTYLLAVIRHGRKALIAGSAIEAMSIANESCLGLSPVIKPKGDAVFLSSCHQSLRIIESFFDPSTLTVDDGLGTVVSGIGGFFCLGQRVFHDLLLTPVDVPLAETGDGDQRREDEHHAVIRRGFLMLVAGVLFFWRVEYGRRDSITIFSFVVLVFFVFLFLLTGFSWSWGWKL